MELSDLKNKKILVVGLGLTGVSLCKFLVKYEADVTVSDHKSKAELSDWLDRMKEVDVKYELGGHSPKVFLQQDIIILSPGVQPQLKIFEYAKNKGVKVTGEFEFSSQFIKEPIVAITGTNGKTTVTSLINEMLKQANITVWIGGNFKAPVSDYLLLEKKPKFVILEVSSFQLEHVEKFSPDYIVFTNLAESHLDRYKSMEDYINAKRKIFKNTSANTISILNADDNAVIELARDPVVLTGGVLYFSQRKFLESQVMNIGGAVRIGNKISVRTVPEIETFDVENVAMRGGHSIENLMAAILVARKLGANSKAIQNVINSYKGLPHRLEYVRKVGGVRFYNDSKATNVHAVKRALETFDENVILVMGGKDSNLNYKLLIDIIKRKVKSLILVGEAKERINREIGDSSETFLIGTFEEAILIAFQKSRINDTVLLSPGCSSFDIFDSYIERGNYFKEIVNKFKS